MEAYTYHTPVLIQATLKYLLTKKNGIYVDGTLGGGGHAKILLEQLENSGRLIGIDLDDDACIAAKSELKLFLNRTTFVKENFRNIKSVLSQCEVNKVQGILLDLGVSSFQIDEPSKGFSFRTDEQLDMRMDQNQEMDAKQVVNQYSEESLTNIFFKYGEEKYSRRIARAIVQYRTLQPIKSTGQLVSIIEQTVGGQFLNKTLARIFQAVRIEINNELENLKQGLYDCIEVLESGGRLVVISYHSLEDRIVKEVFRSASARTISSGNKILPDRIIQPKLNILTKKPITASEEEMESNSRSRSAKLRAAEKI